MKKIFSILLFTIGLWTISVSALELPMESKNAILYLLDTNEILYEKDSEEQISIASLTKIMTAVITLENVSDLEEKVTLTWEDYRGLYEVGASTAGFSYGETVTIRDLLYGLLLPSGAEAAQALTRVVGGHEEFIRLMNEKAEELGLSQTHFVNETGLDADGQHSSVKDVATLFQYALTIPTFKEIILAKSYTTTTGRTFYSTTERAKLRYGLSMDYLLGGKTGTTNEAGLCLASIAEANESNYMLVTCRAPNDWSTPKHVMDAKTIYDYFISHYANQTIVKEGEKIFEIPTQYAEQEKIPVYAKETISKYLEKETSLSFDVTYDSKVDVTPFTKLNTCIGTIHISFLGEELSSFDVFLEQNVSFKKVYFLYLGIFLGILLLLILVLVFLRKRKRKKKKV